MVDAVVDGELGVGEVAVAHLLLLDALEVGADAVGGLDQAPFVGGLVGVHEGLEGGLHVRGEHVHELGSRVGLHGAVGVLDARGLVFDGRGQVAGDDLAHVVIQGQDGHVRGVDGALVARLAQHRQAVGDQRRLHAVLHVVFGDGVAHQPQRRISLRRSR